MDSPTGFNATTLFLADSLSTYSSPPLQLPFPLLSPLHLMLLMFSSHHQRTNSVGSNADSDEDSFRTELPSTSQIENPTPSCITLLIYSHADFSYVDDTWLPGSDDMMDTTLCRSISCTYIQCSCCTDPTNKYCWCQLPSVCQCQGTNCPADALPMPNANPCPDADANVHV